MKLRHNFKRINLINLLFFSTIGLLIVGTSNTIGWFISSFKVTFNDEAFGKGLANYFKSGDGSKDNPYLISNHVHMYNLAWLQDLGYFNEDSDSDGVIDKQYYFKIENDITMPNDYILPPIGTSLYPFLGNFDGGEYTITNLNISNDYSTFKRRPTVVTSDVFSSWNLNIVGTFGIIGSYPNMERITSFSESEEAINQVSGLYLDNVTINTNSSELLVGIFAGYVNGTVYDCGVHYSQIKVNQASSKISNIDGIENSYVSNYSLVGAYNTSKYSWSDGGSWGNDNGWGGSINFYDLARRITYIVGDDLVYDKYNVNFELGTDTTTTKYNNKSGFNVNNIKKTYKLGKNLYNSTGVIYIYNDSFLPLSVDLDEEFNGDEIVTTYQSNNKTITSATTSYFQSNSSEKIISTNPGYITTSTEYETYLDVRNAKNDIKNSLGTSDGSYDENKLVILNIDSSGNISRIVDGNNISNNTNLNSSFSSTIQKESLKKYQNVKEQFSGLFSSDNLLYNWHWSNNISIKKIEDTNKFIMDGATYSSILSPGIDFVVHASGYITLLFAGQYDNSGNSLISLYKVTRNNGNIQSYSQITDGIPSKTDSVFSKSYALLYMEIPVEAGEYFITGSNGSGLSTSANIMYLDIGANSDGSGSDLEDNLKNVDYVGKTNGVLDKVSSTTLSKVAFRIGDSTEAVTYYFRRVNDTVYYYSLNYSFITPSTTGTSVKSKDENCNE